MENPILYYDGECGVCNRCVQFVLRHDSHGRMRFAPLQGQSAQQFLTAEEITTLSTLVLSDANGTFHRSSAVANLLRHLGGGWAWLGFALRMIPVPIRDAGYRMIAANRYRIGGKVHQCLLPSSAERSRFLP